MRLRRAAREKRVRRGFQGARVLAEGSPLEPRDAGGILDLALEGLLARLGPALALALLFFLPVHQIGELLGLSGLEGLSAILASVALMALTMLPYGATAAVVTSLVGDALLDRRAPVAAGIRRGLAYAPGAIVLLLVTQVLTLPLVLLCIAPYFLAQWLTWCALAIYVLEGDALLTSAERARARRSRLAYLASFPRLLARSIARSLRLASGGASFGRWILLAVIGQLVLGKMIELCGMAVAHPEAREYLRAQLGLGGVEAQLALGAIQALFAALAACVNAALAVAYYLDLRVRREGWDLELALARSAEPA